MIDEKAQNQITPSVGSLLRATRMERGLTIEAIAKDLRIGKRQLTQLEEDHECLMCDVYTIGFLRSYGQFLNLNVEELVQKFKDQASHPQPPHLSFPAPLPGRGIPSFRILGLSLCALFLIIMGWEWLGYRGPMSYFNAEPVFVATAPEETVTVDHLLSDASETQLPLEGNPPVDSSFDNSIAEANENLLSIEEDVKTPVFSEGVLLKVSAPAWVEVRDEKGDMVINRLFNPGTYEFKDSQNLVLKTGNAGGISLKSGERELTGLGKSGEVKGEIPLNPEKWLEQVSDTH
jgi:cytoskeletal protein RodZ